MPSENNSSNQRSEVIRSPTIYGEEFTAEEYVDKRHKRRFSGTRIKSFIVPRLHWLLLHTPPVIAKVPVYLVVLLLRGCYWWPRNHLRLACEHLCKIAQSAGHTHKPRQVYQQLMTNFLGAADNYFDLYHKGHDFVLEHVEMSAAETLKVNQLIQDHGGVLIMVPHNFGTLYSTLEMNRTMPLLLVVRNSPTIERTKIAVDFFTRMQFKILLVRGGNPIQHARALLSTLKSDTAVVATVDSLDRSKDRVDVEMFGRQVGLSPWATRIAARLNVPVIPTYCKSRGRELSVVLGSPLISKDLRELTQHYAHFFEQNILEDPASWAFLGDKHWGKVLHKASAELDND